MLEARNVSYVIKGRAIVDGVSAALVPGRLSVIIGPNGAGKSTLLKLLTGELRASSGEVLLDGEELKHLSAQALAARRAVVPQSTRLSFPFSVIEVVLLGAVVPGFTQPAPAKEAAAYRALDDVGLSGFADRLYTELSGGERQRVHVARALCQLSTAPRRSDAPPILLLDEPTSNLDLMHQVKVLEEVRRRVAQGWIALAVLHDLNLASAFADTLILMSNGRVEASGRVDEVFRDDLLSAVYRCRVETNIMDGRRFVLPPPSVA
jgi:iron complex transport system ATP-binding protein